MSSVFAVPEALLAAATDVSTVGSTISAGQRRRGSEHNEAVDRGRGRGIGRHRRGVSARTARVIRRSVHRRRPFTTTSYRPLSGGALSYATAESAAAQPLQSLVDTISAQFVSATGRPRIGNGANGAPGTGTNGGATGGDGGAGGNAVLVGNGGNGGAGGKGVSNGDAGAGGPLLGNGGNA